MNRSFWLILLLLFSATAVGAGWFAVNAPEASRPSFADLGAVRLAKETPPLPPAPLSRPGEKGYEALLRRPLFRASGAEGAGSRRPVGAAAPLAPKAVGYRTVLPPFAAAPARDFIAPATPRAPRDDFQAAFGVANPEHAQYFGPHLIPADSISADGAPPVVAASVRREARPAAAAEAPASVPIPRPRPKRSADAAPREPTQSAVAAAATTRFSEPRSAGEAVGDRALRPEEEIVLLGVLLRQGAKDRALIRLSNGESRRVTLGDEVAGWRVSQISADSIKLQRASVTREIKVPE